MHAPTKMDRSAVINLVGGIGCGVIAYSAIIGIVTVQVMTYYRRFKTDRRAIKVAVAILWIYDMFQLGMLTSSIYSHAIPSWLPKDTNRLVQITWEVATFQVGIIFTSVFTQLYLVYRMYQLSAQPLLTAVVVLLIAAHFSLGIAVQARIYRVENFLQIVAEDKPILVTWLGCAAAVDSIIAIAMCLHLRSKRTGFKQTDNVLRTMSLFAINTGLLTSVVSVIALAGFAAYGFMWIVSFAMVPLGGLYSTTLMANIHSRALFKRKLNAGGRVHSIPIPLEVIPPSQAASPMDPPGSATAFLPAFLRPERLRNHQHPPTSPLTHDTFTPEVMVRVSTRRHVFSESTSTVANPAKTSTSFARLDKLSFQSDTNSNQSRSSADKQKT